MHISRKPIIAGNWKMHGTQAKVQALTEALIAGVAALSSPAISASNTSNTSNTSASSVSASIEIVVCPTFVHLATVKALLANSTPTVPIALGAQNLYLGNEGAFTGEVSGTMLRDIGCNYVLVGHSERRAIFGETNEIVATKFKAALASGLTPILCIGETRAERESNKTEDVLREQLAAVIATAGIESFKHAVIAYEPVWAIGTGLTATPAQAEASQQFIRQYLKQNNVELAAAIRILYGGSMKADNARDLLAMPNIDGGLIGGASLQADSFLGICREACSLINGNHESSKATHEQKTG